MSVTFKVNGQAKTVDVPNDMPLLRVLRDILDMKGTKFGCGIGQCRACTVHVNGTAVVSCRRAVSSVANMEVTTIEGLSADGTHPLQKAWQELDVPQCGYCQAGQIMAAAALLKRVPKPCDDDIDTIANICRCATYGRIKEAIKIAAGTATPAAKSGEEA